jgi:hypothetical protein
MSETDRVAARSSGAGDESAGRAACGNSSTRGAFVSVESANVAWRLRGLGRWSSAGAHPEAGMSDLENWKARQASLKVPTVGNGELFIRCGRGRKGQRWSWSGAPPDSVLASEWERRAEAALAAEHAQFTASDFDGRMVGEAFLEHVIRDPKVLAASEWLCLERPKFSLLFAQGKFPCVVHDSPRQSGASHRAPYANVCRADLKERRVLRSPCRSGAPYFSAFNL